METKYKCNSCGWQGLESELGKEAFESCMGNNEIEVCSKCGSMDLEFFQKNNNKME